jgi:hypothetical protein
MQKRAAPERPHIQKVETRQIEIRYVETKFVGVSIPMPLHRELRMEAAREGTSASQLYRKAIVEYLDKVKR